MSRPQSAIGNCHYTVGQKIQLLWEKTDFDFTVRECPVPDEDSADYIPIRHKTLSHSNVKSLSAVQRCLIVDWGP